MVTTSVIMRFSPVLLLRCEMMFTCMLPWWWVTRRLLVTAGHGRGDVHRVLPALPSTDARDAQVLPGVHRRLQDHLRLEEVGDRSTGWTNEHRSDEAHWGYRVGQRAVTRARRQGERTLRGVCQGRQGCSLPMSIITRPPAARWRANALFFPLSLTIFRLDTQIPWTGDS